MQKLSRVYPSLSLCPPLSRDCSWSPRSLSLRRAAGVCPSAARPPSCRDSTPAIKLLGEAPLPGAPRGYWALPRATWSRLPICPACSGTSSRRGLPRPWDKPCSTTGALPALSKWGFRRGGRRAGESEASVPTRRRASVGGPQHTAASVLRPEGNFPSLSVFLNLTALLTYNPHHKIHPYKVSNIFSL